MFQTKIKLTLFLLARDKCKTDSDCSGREICRLNVEGVKDCIGMYWILIFIILFIRTCKPIYIYTCMCLNDFESQNSLCNFVKCYLIKSI